MAQPVDPDRPPTPARNVDAAQAPEQHDRPAREKQRGPVTLRRDQAVEGSTTDQRLLDSRGPSDWVHTDPWRGPAPPSRAVGRLGPPRPPPPSLRAVGPGRPHTGAPPGPPGPGDRAP